jgi:hypothetical protein
LQRCIRRCSAPLRTARLCTRLIRAPGRYDQIPGTVNSRFSELKDGSKDNGVITLTEDLTLAQAADADTAIRRGNYRGPLHGIAWGARIYLQRALPNHIRSRAVSGAAD